MWGRQVDGKVLTFRLAGINNQNFLMRDEETGSFWQQISGLAISGPLAGRQLTSIHWDELSFNTYRDENQEGSVLLPVAKYEKKYAAKDWELKMKKSPTVVDTKKTGIEARELMIGVELNAASRAYAYRNVQAAKLIQDRLGGEAILLVLSLDGVSVRGFLAALPDEKPDEKTVPDFYRKEELGGGLIIDSLTGGEWNFQGCAVSGRLTGRCLAPLRIVKDYWFDWQLYHPQTSVFRP